MHGGNKLNVKLWLTSSVTVQIYAWWQQAQRETIANVLCYSSDICMVSTKLIVKLWLTPSVTVQIYAWWQQAHRETMANVLCYSSDNAWFASRTQNS